MAADVCSANKAVMPCQPAVSALPLFGLMKAPQYTCYAHPQQHSSWVSICSTRHAVSTHSSEHLRTSQTAYWAASSYTQHESLWYNAQTRAYSPQKDSVNSQAAAASMDNCEFNGPLSNAPAINGCHSRGGRDMLRLP